MSMDIEEVAALLEIVDRCASHSGKLASISSAALNRLFEINGQLRAEQMAAAAPPAPEPEPLAPDNADDISQTPDVRRDADAPTIADRRV